MPIDFYASKFSPPCRAVLMGLKQLNLDFNQKPLDMRNGENKTPEFLKINPAHCVPTIVDDDFPLWESRAILQYLANKYAPDSSLYPRDAKKRALVDRTLNFDFSYFQSLREALLSPLFRGTEPTEQQLKNFENNLQLLNTLIGQNKYVTGNDLTIADIALLASTTLLAVKEYKNLETVPNVKAWFERLQKELPYYEEVNGGVFEHFKARLQNAQQNKQ